MSDYPKLKQDAVCFHCDPCIAKNPPKEPNQCGWSCDECKCDVCRDAGKK